MRHIHSKRQFFKKGNFLRFVLERATCPFHKKAAADVGKGLFCISHKNVQVDKVIFYSMFTVMLSGFTFSGFGTLTSKTPFSNLALILSGLMADSSVKDR